MLALMSDDVVGFSFLSPTLTNWTFFFKSKKYHKFGLLSQIYAFHRHNKAIYLHNYAIVLQSMFGYVSPRISSWGQERIKNQHMFEIILWVLVFFWIACFFHFMCLRFDRMHSCWPNGTIKKQSYESRDSHWHHCEMSISMKLAVLAANYKPHTDWNANGPVVWNHQTFIGYDLIRCFSLQDIIVVPYWFCNLSMMWFSHVTLSSHHFHFLHQSFPIGVASMTSWWVKWKCVHTKKAIQDSMYK